MRAGSSVSLSSPARRPAPVGAVTSLVTVLSVGCATGVGSGTGQPDGMRDRPGRPGQSSSRSDAAPAWTGSPTASGGDGTSHGKTAARPRSVTAPRGPAGLPLVVRSGPADRRRIALTFDADMTPAMLHRLQSGAVGSYYNSALIDELRRRRCPPRCSSRACGCSTIPTSRASWQPTRCSNSVHTPGNRAFTTSCYGLPTARPSQMLNEVLRVQRLLDRLAGYGSTRLFAFPAAAMTPPRFERSRRPASRQCSSTSRPGTGFSRTQVSRTGSDGGSQPTRG